MRSRLSHLLVVAYFLITDCYGAVFNINKPVHYFTNQDIIIRELKNILDSNEGIANVSGVKGIGKTELVKRYYSSNQKNYKTVGYFDTSTSLILQLINFAQKLNEENKEANRISLDPESIRSNIIKYLSKNNKWLLIFDNTHSNSDEVKEFTKLKGKGHIIFVSFNNPEKDGRLVVNSLELKHINKLLKKIMKEPDNDLIKELGVNLAGKGCPTALVVDSAYFLLNNPHYNIKEYIKKVEKENDMVKNYLELTLNTLSKSAQEIFFKIALLNNGEISKNIISYTINDKSTSNELISELLNTNILQMKNKDREKPIFKIHDIYKDEILKFLSLKKKQQIIQQIVPAINLIFPTKFKNGSEIRKTFMKDKTLSGNIEILLSNIKAYNVPINFDTLELVLNILLNSIELCYMDKYYECINWFKIELDRNKIIPNSFKEKSTFSTVLINLAASEFFDNINATQALIYLYQAKEIATDALEFSEINSYIYTDIAQILTIKGDIISAKKFVEKAEKIITDKSSGIVKILYVRSLMNLLGGNYNKALEKINEEISLCKELNFSVHNPPLVVLKTKILNALKKYKEAYNYINHWYIDNAKEFSNYASDDKSAVLSQLSNAELGINKISKALEHSKLAIDILIEDKKRNNNVSLDISVDIFLAEALIALGNALSETGALKESLIEYNKAEKIFRNVYQENFSKIDNVNYLMLQGAKVAYKLNNRFWYKHYSELLKKYLPSIHERVQELINNYDLYPETKLQD